MKIAGQIEADGKPLAGAILILQDTASCAVIAARLDDAGVYQVEVPEGQYLATLLLPDLTGGGLGVVTADDRPGEVSVHELMHERIMAQAGRH